MRNQRLTPSYVEKATYRGDKSQDIRWDLKKPGFGLRIYPSGKKTYVIKTGNQMVALGNADILSLEEAREKHLEILRDKKRGQLLPSKSSVSLIEFSKHYMTLHAKQHKKSWRADELMLKNCILPKFGHMRLSEITRAHIALWLAEVGIQHEVRSNRLHALLSKMFSLAIAWGFLPEAHLNPVKGIPKFKETSRFEFIRREDLPTFYAAVDKEERQDIRVYFRLLILTGARVRELQRLRWEDVNVQDCELTFRDTKNGQDHILPTAKKVIHLLLSLPRHSEWVFPSPQDPRKHMDDYRKPWLRIESRLPDRMRERLVPHDLRRTAGSLMAQAGIPLHLISQVLNQSSESVTKIYARFTKEHVREASQTLSAIAFSPPPALEVGLETI